MKRLNNVYPVYIFGRQFFVTFDHFTNQGAAVYNVEFLAIGSAAYLVRYKGIIASNQDHAAKIALEKFEKEV